MMGWYYGDHMSGWGWLAMTVSTVLFVVLLVLGGMLVVRFARQAQPPGPRQAPEQVLAEQYARGTISEEEYRRRLAVLTDTGALNR